MKVATWNVNSIRARLHRVTEYIHKERPHVLCLQETKVENEAFPKDPFRELGYELAIHGQKTYNGVAILSRTPLSGVQCGFSDGLEDTQARLIAATTNGLRIVSLYVPNGQAVGSDKLAYKFAWMGRLRSYLEGPIRQGLPLLACGDFNVAPEPIDVHDPAAWEDSVLFTREERAALARLKDVGLTDLVRKVHPDKALFTWWDYRNLAFPKNHGLRIDHIFGTHEVCERMLAAGVDREARKGKEPSDHAPAWVELAS
ncbi:MAG: exodeoxyribonuclease III [Deltaproteobacteria bacterium]|nr:exodeoxyribonuclease III [Deltaproteobacteria bacterium]